MATRITRTLRQLASATTDRGRRMIGPRLSDLGDRASGLALRWRDDLRENPAGRIVVQLMDDLVQRLHRYARQIDAGDAAGNAPRRGRSSRQNSSAASTPARSRQTGRAATASAPDASAPRRARSGKATAAGERKSSGTTTGRRVGGSQAPAGEAGVRAASRRKRDDDGTKAASGRKGAATSSAGSRSSSGKRQESTGNASTTPARSRSKTEGGRPRTP